MNKSTAWYIMFPNDVYAMGPVRFNKPTSESQVKQWARNWAGVTRLPNGFSCWKTND